jgi:hypothetical protein
MAEHGAICRLGVFYDGSFFSYAQNYYYHERQLGWLRFPELHRFLEKYIGLREQGFASYKVVYAAWHQGLFTAKDATADQLKRDRDRYHDMMHAGVDPKYLPMSQKHGEKGVDVALAVDALQVGLGQKDRRSCSSHRRRRLRSVGSGSEQARCSRARGLLRIRGRGRQQELHQRALADSSELRG